MNPTSPRSDSARLASARYRIIYAVLYVVILGAGLVYYRNQWGGLSFIVGNVRFWVESIAQLCVATAGVSFALAELVEGVIVLGQAMREIIDERRRKREERWREEGRLEERERLRKQGVNIPPDEPDSASREESTPNQGR